MAPEPVTEQTADPAQDAGTYTASVEHAPVPAVEPAAPVAPVAVAANPQPRVGPIVSAAVVALLLLGGTVAGIVLWRRKVMGAGQPVGSRAVLQSIIDEAGGAISATLATDLALEKLNPDCPEDLDPDNAEHAACIQQWLDLYAEALELLGGARSSNPSSPATRVEAFLESLTPTEQDEFRLVLGPEYYDPLAQAAAAEDETRVRREISKINKHIERLVPEQRTAKLWRIQSALGAKTDELATIVG